MKTAQIIRKSDQKVIAKDCLITENFLDRMKGLMGRSSLHEDEALWILPCNSIHTFFMNFPIDVVYMDPKGRVLEVHSNLKPWKMHWPKWGATSVLELPAGKGVILQQGDELCIS